MTICYLNGGDDLDWYLAMLPESAFEDVIDEIEAGETATPLAV